jgi:outer membrane protein insertion porin family
MKPDMKRIYLSIAIFIFLLSLATHLPAMTIDAVRIENLDQAVLDASFVEAYTTLRAGQEVESEADLNAAVARDVDNLRRSERFSYVRAFVEQEDGRLTLVYSVSPRLRLRKIEIAGAERIGSRKVNEQLELELGDFVDEAIVGEKVRAVETYCRRNKYPDATISWELTPDPETSAADLLLNVNEGEKLRVSKVSFESDSLLSDRFSARSARFFKQLIPGKEFETNGKFISSDLRGLLMQKKTWWITPWFGGYKPEVVPADRQALRKAYRDEGYLDVQVFEPALKEHGGGEVELMYRIDEGPRYRIGSVDISGVTEFELSDVKNQIRIQEGEIASGGAIEATAAAVTRYYGNRGYINSYVVPDIETDPVSRLATIVFRVREGGLARINQIDIRGNEKTRDEVIRRELAVYPGEAFHQQKVETSERRLQNLSYFETVSSSYTPAGQHAGTNSYDLAFRLKEKSMGSFLIGAGFSSVDSIVGFAEVSHGNFDIQRWPPVGDGQKIKVRAQVGSERNDLEVSFVEPWFRDRKLALGVDLYHRDAGYYSDDYSLKTVGARVSLSKPLGPFIRGTLSYSLESFDVYDVSAPANSIIAREEGTRTKSTIGVSVTRDTRDQYFAPTRGNQTVVSTEFSGGPLAGDTEIYLLEARSSHFWPLLNDHVFNLKGEIRTVDSYGSGDVPIFDRLFLGGPRSLRGFAYRDVSPRDPNNNNEPYGGQSSYFATAEYTVPLWSKIRGAAFYDIGAVGENAFEFFDADLNSNYGIGARFDLPMFPLRLDYAFPHITDDSNENAAPRWNFMLGYTF